MGIEYFDARTCVKCTHPIGAHESTNMGILGCLATVYSYSPHKPNVPYQTGQISEIGFTYPCPCRKFKEATDAKE